MQDSVKTENVAISTDRVMQGLFTEKLVTDRGRQSLLNDPAFLRYGPKLVSNQFFLVVINILDYVPAAGTAKYDFLRADAVQQMFSECMSREYLCYPFVCDGDQYVLVNLRQKTDTTDAAAVEARNRRFIKSCDESRKYLLKHGVRVQLFLSPIIDGYEEFDLRLEDLRHILYTEFGEPPANDCSEDIITQVDMDRIMSETCKRDMALASGLEQGFYNAVMRRNFDEAYEIVCNLIDIESKSFAASISLKHRLCNKIEALFSLLGVPYFCPEANLYGVHQLIKWMEDTITVDDMKSQMNMALNEFKRYFTTVVVTTSSRMNQIAEYIDQHYMDYDLCADFLCEKFDISMSYLSRAFKSCIGTKLIDYIHATKLNAAKKQLLTTNDTIEKIAADVGYQSSLTFTRAFKRYEMMTPGMYRSAGSAQGEDNMETDV